jgi:hypothetical protein
LPRTHQPVNNRHAWHEWWLITDNVVQRQQELCYPDVLFQTK